MKIRHLYSILIILLCCCNKPINGQKPYGQEFGCKIPELEIVDKNFQNQIENIVFTSDCFMDNKSDKFITISNSQIYTNPNLLYVSFRSSFECDKDVIENIIGGFYIGGNLVESNSRQYLFIIYKNVPIPIDAYKQTNKMIDVTEYASSTKIIIDEDAGLYIKNSDGNLVLIFTMCPNLEIYDNEEYNKIKNN
jgi:hypothetical protein